MILARLWMSAGGENRQFLRKQVFLELYTKKSIVHNIEAWWRKQWYLDYVSGPTYPLLRRTISTSFLGNHKKKPSNRQQKLHTLLSAEKLKDTTTQSLITSILVAAPQREPPLPHYRSSGKLTPTTASRDQGHRTS